jgi:hypothetical protein
MNKRILELAKQAGFDVKRIMAMHPGGFPRDDFLALESFAELIVKECCQKLENDGMVEVAMEMKQHFGVEE